MISAHCTKGSISIHVCVCVCAFTFRNGVEVRFLTHGGEQRKGTDVNAHLGVAVVLPGIILDHVEQPADQVQHAVLWVVLEAHARGVYAALLLQDA